MGGGGDEIFCLCNPHLFVGLGDGFGRFPRAVWGEIIQVCSVLLTKVGINTGSNLGIVFGNILSRA